jgi:hypothetical protein
MPDTRRKTPVTKNRRDAANVHAIAVRATEHAAAHGREVTKQDVVKAHRHVMSQIYKDKAVPGGFHEKGGDLPPSTDENALKKAKELLQVVPKGQGPPVRDAFGKVKSRQGGRTRRRRRRSHK